MTIDSRTQANNRPFIPGTNDSASTTANTPITAATATPTSPPKRATASMDPLNTEGGQEFNNVLTGQRTANTATDAGKALAAQFQAAQTDAAIYQILNDPDYDDNVLSSLRNPTYHFKLYMTTEHEIVTGAASSDISSLYKTLDDLPKVVLAESGVTAGFNIQSVELETAVTPGFSNRSATLTDIKIRLVEPLGSSFLEALITAGMSLGVKNFAKFWYFLELTFKGYDEDGNIIESPLEPMNLTNGGRFIWCININEVNFRLDEGKAEYTLSCTPSSSTAFSEDGTGMSPENIKVSGGTIKEFCDDLGKQLTEAWKRRYAGEIYKINIVHRSIRDCKDDVNSFVLSQSEHDPIRGLKFEDDPKRSPVAQIPHGTRIDDIIVFLWAHCEGAQKLMLDTTDPKNLDDGEGDTVTYNGKKYRMAVTPFIEADVKVTGYDPVTGHYKKEITYNVWGWRTASANISPGQWKNVKDDPSVAVSIAKELRQKRYLRKRYYYRYTGLNTEILRFDLDFNLAFSAILPRTTGWRSNIDAVAMHEKKNPVAAKDNGSYNDSKNEVSIDIQKANEKLDQYANDIITQEDIVNSSNSTADGRAAAQARIATIQQQRSQLEQQLSRVRADFDAASKKQMEEIEAKAPKNIYAEDAQGTPLPFQISYAQRYGEPAQAAGIGFLGQWHRGTSLVGSLLNQVYQPVADALLTVTMDIRGDPYWLGYSHVERRAFLNNPSADPMPDGRPNYQEGDNTFAVILKFPSRMDGETGQPIIRETTTPMGNADLFNGFYRVNNIRHTFEGGEFKQTLTATKLELIQAVNTSAPPSTKADNQK